MEKEIWQVKEVPEQTTKIIYNTRTGKSYDLIEVLSKILNGSPN